MTTNTDIKAPYHIAFAGAVLGVAESASSFFFIEYIINQSPFQVSQAQMMFTLVSGLLISLAITGYLYYNHRNENLKKDSFLYVIVAAVLGLIIGGQLSSLIVLIGAIICYRRL